MKTYNTVATETDINGVDSNEELTALFAKALELCQTVKHSQVMPGSPSNTQYLSLQDVTYCIRSTESVDLKPIPLPDVDYNRCLESMQTFHAHIKQEIPDNRDMTVNNGCTEVVDIDDSESATVDELDEESTSHLNQPNITTFCKEVLHCVICDKVYRSQESFEEHVKVHEEEDLDLETQQNENMGFVADKHRNHVRSTHYDKIYASQGPFQKHIANHNETFFIEESAGNEDQEIMEKTRLSSEHNMGEHSTLEIPRAAAQTIIEQDSDSQEIDSSQTLDKKQSRKKQHICPYCNRDYKYFSILENHIRTHTKEKPFQCQHCDKAFTRIAILKEHEVRHYCNNKPYKCSFCTKSFVNQKELNEHRGIHTGERPHKCEFCEKTFMKRRDLLQHIGTHSGERPHQCDFCEKKFKRKGDLGQHLKTHTGERPHKCTICEKAFIRKGQLTHHLRLHTGERPYKCDFCDKAFIRKGQLDLHLMQKHA